MHGGSPEPYRHRHRPAQAGWPDRGTRWEALRHAVGRSRATHRGLTQCGVGWIGDRSTRRPTSRSLAEAGNCSNDTAAPTVNRTHLRRSLERLPIWRGTGSQSSAGGLPPAAITMLTRAVRGRWNWSRTDRRGFPGLGLSLVHDLTAIARSPA